MRTLPPKERPGPPALAETLLRRLLEPRNRDAVSGDLLEEYREVVLPTRGSVRARLWYTRQVLSFVTPAALAAAVTGSSGEHTMISPLSRTSLTWYLAGTLALAVLVGGLVRSGFGPPAGLWVLIAFASAAAVAGLASLKSRPDVTPLIRSALCWGALLSAVLLARLLVDALAPVDPLDRFLAQARDDYSEFDYPRRWLPAVAVAAIFVGAGFLTAWRTNRVGKGTLAAMAASMLGSLVYIALVALGNTLPFGPEDPLGNTPADLQYFGSVPTGLAPVLLMFSAVLGSIGAMFGRGVAARRGV